MVRLSAAMALRVGLFSGSSLGRSDFDGGFDSFNRKLATMVSTDLFWLAA
jgi:hypothetical protein